MTGRRIRTTPEIVATLTACSAAVVDTSTLDADALATCRRWGWITPERYELTADGRKLAKQLGVMNFVN